MFETTYAPERASISTASVSYFPSLNGKLQAGFFDHTTYSLKFNEIDEIGVSIVSNELIDQKLKDSLVYNMRRYSKTLKDLEEM